MTEMKLLVTGGLGFIGSNYVLQAIKSSKFQQITNIDSMSYGSNPENLREAENTRIYEFVKADINDLSLVTRQMADADIVVHLAAESHVDRSISEPKTFLNSNVLGTFTLLEAARHSKVCKFVHISTDEVYGSASSGEAFHENSPLDPSSPYSASKAAAEMLALAYYKTYGVPIVILRCTNNFGPRQFPEKLIPKTIIRALLGLRVPVYGSGQQIRDWIHVSDFCKAIDLATEIGVNGHIYNVSAKNEISNLEMVTRILNILAKSSNLIESVDDRPGHDFRYSLNSSRITEELGWKPERSFFTALESTVKWYVQNENWWKPLLNAKILSPTPWKEKW
jgi:dTDP-glucose 4,6-dehydratase